VKQFVRRAARWPKTKEQGESGARSNAANSALERFGIRRLNEQWNPGNRWYWKLNAYGDEYYDGRGEASPAKAVQAAETRLFAVEVAKRRAG
jgi:hypothetical protein